jgi:hypothetical protein
LHFFVRRLQRTLLQREYKVAVSKDPDIAENADDFAFQKIVKQAREEVKLTLTRLIYRAKYNLPPNDPRFLELTDEQIVYELALQSEYNKWVNDKFEEEEVDDSRVIFRNTDEYNEMAKKMERNESLDLESLMTPDEDWEKVDG